MLFVVVRAVVVEIHVVQEWGPEPRICVHGLNITIYTQPRVSQQRRHVRPQMPYPGCSPGSGEQSGYAVCDRTSRGRHGGGRKAPGAAPKSGFCLPLWGQPPSRWGQQLLRTVLSSSRSDASIEIKLSNPKKLSYCRPVKLRGCWPQI